ncbi:MAG: nitroreductase family protein [Eubacteriales bacterium]|nr:nitroreductase family protein [Eubacteriales bacterium]
MDLLEMMKQRRSIRKYRDEKVERGALEKIAEAGIFAPNPGGAQGARVVMLDDPVLIERIGVVNAEQENRNWNGRSVSADQPSIIDDLSIRSGFYGCPALAIVCVPQKSRNFVNGIGSAFVCAENMVLEAHSLGVSSCIVGRAEPTFAQPELQALWQKWGLEEYAPVVFVCLGYIDGPYPPVKPRKEGRVLFPEG